MRTVLVDDELLFGLDPSKVCSARDAFAQNKTVELQLGRRPGACVSADAGMVCSLDGANVVFLLQPSGKLDRAIHVQIERAMLGRFYLVLLLVHAGLVHHYNCIAIRCFCVPRVVGAGARGKHLDDLAPR
jgi:hypothetical protein